jgi:hypothetical protein
VAYSFKDYLKEISLEYHEQLNPVLWDGDSLKPDVRQHLLKIAHEWITFAKIPGVAVHDILLTGGNCNFNYTPFSDVDVHVLMDFQKVSQDKELVYDYYMDKKSMWAKAHENLRIRGFPVELYAQPLTEGFHAGQGVYSLSNDEWLAHPKYETVDFSNPFLQQKIDYYKKVIDDLVDNKTTDAQTVNELREKLRLMRSNAIAQNGELSQENLVFKDLRNEGYLKKLSQYLYSVQDQELSLQ